MAVTLGVAVTLCVAVTLGVVVTLGVAVTLGVVVTLGVAVKLGVAVTLGVAVGVADGEESGVELGKFGELDGVGAGATAVFIMMGSRIIPTDIYFIPTNSNNCVFIPSLV